MSGLKVRIHQALFASAMLLSAVGCQSNSMMNAPWNQPTRVPPPNAPTNLPTATPYANPMNPTPGGMQPSVAAPKSVSSYSNSPLTDAVASAQNELRMATDSARAAIEKSANSVNDTVSQAGARIDRVGSGVVQAAGVIESSLKDPIPFPPVPAAGSISDAPKDDPNAQWRKPTVR